MAGMPVMQSYKNPGMSGTSGITPSKYPGMSGYCTLQIPVPGIYPTLTTSTNFTSDIWNLYVDKEHVFNKDPMSLSKDISTPNGFQTGNDDNLKSFFPAPHVFPSKVRHAETKRLNCLFSRKGCLSNRVHFRSKIPNDQYTYSRG